MGNSYTTTGGTDYSTVIKKIELQNAHEQSQLKEKNAHEIEMTKTTFENQKILQEVQHAHDERMLDRSLGQLGQFFGNQENASKNITAVVCLSFIIGATIISLLVYFCKGDTSFIKNMWTCTSPIITLSLGYLFGKK